jgi:hypothetical protein
LAIITIWQEARGESYEGKVGIAEVLRNRTARKYSSDGTVTGTVLWGRQFSGMNPNDPNRIPSFKIDADDPVVQDCARAWDEARQGSDRTNGAVHYLNVPLTRQLLGGKLPTWAADPENPAEPNPHRVTVVLGQHTFLRAD